jgi:hypothetical protein
LGLGHNSTNTRAGYSHLIEHLDKPPNPQHAMRPFFNRANAFRGGAEDSPDFGGSKTGGKAREFLGPGE